MRILRIIYDWPPPWLGLAASPYEITKVQSEMKHTIDVFCGRWPKAGPIVTINNVKLHPIIRAPLQGTIAFTSSIILFFQYLQFRRKNKTDIIHSHGHFALWIYIYRVILNRFFPWLDEMKTPFVVHFHNTVRGRKEKLEASNSPIKNISKYIDWPMAELSDRMAIKCADACIFVSEELRDEAIKYYKADPSKCFVVGTGVNTQAFLPMNIEEIAKTRIELGFEPTDKIILSLGAIVERKNIHLIVEALEFLPKNYKLMIVGEGDEEYMNKIDLIITQKRLDGRVLKVGYTPYPQIPIAYQASDLFVIPSSFEGRPKAAMESLACGTQVLAFGFRLSEKVEGIEYLDDLSVQSIVSKIKDMIQNPRNVDIFAIKKNESWNLKAEQIEKVYEYAYQNYQK